MDDLFAPESVLSNPFSDELQDELRHWVVTIEPRSREYKNLRYPRLFEK